MATITIEHVEYEVGEIDTDRVHEAYAHFRKTRGNPFDAIKGGVLEGLPEAAQREAVRQAYLELRDGPSQEQFFRWLDEPDGVRFTFWIMLRQANPELTQERSGELFSTWMSEVIAEATRDLAEESEMSISLKAAAEEAALDRARRLRDEQYDASKAQEA